MRLILHIGMHKTGSSAIQHVFSRNRTLLRLAGIHYATGGRRWPKHAPLFAASSHENDHGTPHPDHGTVADLLAALPHRGTVLVSAEGLSGPHPGHAAQFQGSGAEVILVLRNPVEWAPAMHAQMVRSREVREMRTLDDWVRAEDVVRHLDYASLIRRWKRVGTVTIVPYANPILPRFLAGAHLPGWIARLPGGAIDRNPTPCRATIEKRRVANGGTGGPGPAPDLRVLAEEQRAQIIGMGYPAPWPSQKAS